MRQPRRRPAPAPPIPHQRACPQCPRIPQGGHWLRAGRTGVGSSTAARAGICPATPITQARGLAVSVNLEVNARGFGCVRWDAGRSAQFLRVVEKQAERDKRGLWAAADLRRSPPASAEAVAAPQGTLEHRRSYRDRLAAWHEAQAQGEALTLLAAVRGTSTVRTQIDNSIQTLAIGVERGNYPVQQVK